MTISVDIPLTERCTLPWDLPPRSQCKKPKPQVHASGFVCFALAAVLKDNPVSGHPAMEPLEANKPSAPDLSTTP